MKAIQLVCGVLKSVGTITPWQNHFCPTIEVEGVIYPLNGDSTLICPLYAQELRAISSVLSRRGIRYRLVK